MPFFNFVAFLLTRLSASNASGDFRPAAAATDCDRFPPCSALAAAVAVRRPRRLLALLLLGATEDPFGGTTVVVLFERPGWSRGANSCTQVTKMSDTCRHYRAKKKKNK